jgi:hypothetical protein
VDWTEEEYQCLCMILTLTGMTTLITYGLWLISRMPRPRRLAGTEGVVCC